MKQAGEGEVSTRDITSDIQAASVSGQGRTTPLQDSWVVNEQTSVLPSAGHILGRI